MTMVLDQHPILVMAFQTAAGLINLTGKMKVVRERGQHPILVMAFQTAVGFLKLTNQTYKFF